MNLKCLMFSRQIFGCYGIRFAYFNEHSMDTMQYLLIMPNLFTGINENKLLKLDLLEQ